MQIIEIEASDIEAAVQEILPYLEDTSNNAIYFDGWYRLGASAVLRAIAEHPPPSLKEKFNKIINIDCLRWKSRRALQRAIADELRLTEHVAADFDRQDEEDDFRGIAQGSRAEIASVARVIALALVQYRCLFVFHNGSDGIVDLTSYGIPQPQIFGTKVLWTFRGRFRLDGEILEKVEKSSHLPICAYERFGDHCNALVEEVREITLYIDKLGLGVSPEIVTQCCMYLLSLNYEGGDIIEYNWKSHASSYWVCDGIVEGGQDNQAWELARALQQHIRLEHSSDEMFDQFLRNFDIGRNWVASTDSDMDQVYPWITSLFFAPTSRYESFLNSMFYEANQLRVLKLCRCTFSFSSPPFHCCRNLRFLGLERCMDEQQLGEEEDEKTGARAVETFQRLWVLDVCQTDWELPFSLETEEQLATQIREVHIYKGRIWCGNLAWRRLPNLHKLRVVEPTSSWETGRKDEFIDMVKLELLDLSRNKTLQILPMLSGATNLKALVLDGCVGLEHVGPQGLPPYLESFCLDAGAVEDDKNAKISCINLAGCARLTDFRLRGSLPKLEELDLSYTAVKMLDLRDVHASKYLKKIFLVGCKQLRSISWPLAMHQLRLLCIDTRSGGEMAREQSSCDSLMVGQGKGEEDRHAFIGLADMRFLQSLDSLDLWETTKFKVNLCFSSSIIDGGQRPCHEEKIVHPYSSTKPLAYHDVRTGQHITTQIDGSSSSSATTPFQPLDLHMEIGEGISDVTNMVSAGGRDEILYVMNRIKSLHVHDNSSITTVTPGHIFLSPENYEGIMEKGVKWCRVERCPRMETVFVTMYDDRGSFNELETFWADHLLMARSIWSTPRPTRSYKEFEFRSFERLRAIHLHLCPRLKYVVQLFSNYDLSNHLETLRILCCSDLRQVFPVERKFLRKIATSHKKGMLPFPKLKDLYLHELPSLQLICKAKMFAPNLETIYLRGCWSLRRLPATDSGRRQDGRPVAVDCEKDLWDKLEWDGMEQGHHPSLFKPRHSRYYKKRHLRGTVLR